MLLAMPGNNTPSSKSSQRPQESYERGERYNNTKTQRHDTRAYDRYDRNEQNSGFSRNVDYHTKRPHEKTNQSSIQSSSNSTTNYTVRSRSESRERKNYRANEKENYERTQKSDYRSNSRVGEDKREGRERINRKLDSSPVQRSDLRDSDSSSKEDSDGASPPPPSYETRDPFITVQEFIPFNSVVSTQKFKEVEPINVSLSNKQPLVPTNSNLEVSEEQEQEQEQKPVYDPFPWFNQSLYNKEPTIMLHEEIKAFTEYMSPTPEEKKVREYIIKRLTQVVHQLWPTAEVRVFGSYDTNLYLPTSDLDMVVLYDSLDSVTLIRTLARALQRVDFKGSMKVIDKARVPIIKFQDNIVHYEVDISFNIKSGMKAAETIKEKLDQYPALRPLSFVLKHFLHQRELNEVFSGGLSSFSTILLIISFFQMHVKIQQGVKAEANLGILLVEFFELYGKNFNYNNVGISINGEGSYFPKTNSGYGRFLLSIKDPQDPDNDVAFNTFNIHHIRTSFSHAYDVLTLQLSLAKNEHEMRDSLLGKIVWVDESIQKFRRLVKQKAKLID